MTTNSQIIAQAFTAYQEALLRYVSARINNAEEARDIVQDVFVRLLSYDVVATETVKSLCYTIAGNIVIDHIRRYYKRQEVYTYYKESEGRRTTLTPEQVAAFHDLADKERCLIMNLAPSTRRVYEMSQIDGDSIEEIAESLGISQRTVECHQYRGRKYMRAAIRNII